MRMKSTEEILNALRNWKVDAQTKYRLTRLGLFGSCARGQQREDSDIDICFDGETPSLLTMARMEIELENRLGCPVQMTMLHDGLPEGLKNAIKRDVIYV